jgi:Mg2+ and Co2+ transporter CorA
VHVPGIDLPYGFFGMLLGMVVIVVAMLGYMKFKKWF